MLVARSLSMTLILVPQGAEYQAVCRGLRQGNSDGQTLEVLPIPAGVEPLRRYFQGKQFGWSQTTQVLVMGVCGGLAPSYRVGEIVLYQDCLFVDSRAEVRQKNCDRTFAQQLLNQLPYPISWVSGFTSDRLIASAPVKQDLAQRYQTDVVDMEGFIILEALEQTDIAIAMLRVISDESHQNLPDLSQAFSSEGSLKPLELTRGMLKKPLAALKLIQSSLKALKVLEQIAASLAQQSID